MSNGRCGGDDVSKVWYYHYLVLLLRAEQHRETLGNVGQMQDYNHGCSHWHFKNTV